MLSSKTSIEWPNFKYIIFVIPILVVLGFLDVYPIAYTLYISMTNFNTIHFFTFEFVGLRNYGYLFSPGSHFLQILGNTAVFSFGSLALMVPTGFLLALLMNQKGLRGRSIYRTIYLFPWAFPAFITVLVWQNMFQAQYGVINQMLKSIGIIGPSWLTSKNYAMFSLIFVNFWLSFSYYTFVYTAAIQSIPSELYESAQMDGYGAAGILKNVTLPLLSRQIAFITIFGFIFTWNNFYPAFLLTGGGPGFSTQILITISYTEAFSYSQYAIGAAYSFVSILILLALVIVANRYTKMMSVIT